MGLSTNGKPITPYVGSWAWEMEQRRKLGALREEATALFVHGRHAEFIERSDEAANLERRLKRDRS
ncbi:hypothetical protein BC361_25835 [Ensifer sp. LC54]|uniref:hypothetical protein n=1 Tax=Ensifer sp. LC384 TaxID=1120653 RepID=UPI0008134988|nr:hypothetical protein [Ensifer sp. LC384]OCP21991.1 hypothetical protein BC361_25835 [Ensifer sp. LC54]OCP23229.1 hypothetical protein BC363_24930 [Ensifer sp. LC384]